MATRPFVEKPVPPPIPVADRLLLAEELLDLAERAQTHTRAAGGAIALRSGEKLFIRTSTGIAPEVGSSLLVGEGTVGECARVIKPLTVSEEARIDAPLRALGVRSLVAVPIHHAGIFYGVLMVTALAPEAFTRMHVAIMMTMGNEIARVLKRLEGSVDIAPGMPLRPAMDNVVAMSRPLVTSPQDFGEMLKAIEGEPVKPAYVAGDASDALKAAPQVEAISFVELQQMPEPSQPLPELLCPGEDPRQYGTIKAKALEPKPTFTVSTAYRPASSSSRKTPAIAVAVLVVVAAAYGMWRHRPAQEQPHSVAAAAAEPAVAATVPTPVAPEPAKTTAPAPPPVFTVTPEAKRTITAKDIEEVATDKPHETALRIAAPAPKKAEAEPVEAPSLAFAAAAGLPELPAAKAPAAALAVRKSTAAPPALIRSVQPVYPEFARRAGVSGEVQLQMRVLPSGDVSNVRALSGPAMLRQAAIDAVSRWQYRPGTLDGRPVESSVEVTVKFAAKK